MKSLFSFTSRKWKEARPNEDKWRVKKEEQRKSEEDESQPLINLGLGIGGPSTSSRCCSSFDHHNQRNNSCVSNARSLKLSILDFDCDDDLHQVAENRGKQRRNTQCSVVCFTGEQLEELKSQIIVFKYLVCGLPISIQFLPWTTNLSPPPLYHLNYKTPFLLGTVCLGSSNRHKMDPEPGRCRRTDGKKWRCHKSVVPNEKYCENHMHRGRKRSRKLVEEPTGVTCLNTHTPDPTNTNKRDSPNIDFKIKFPAKDHKPHPPTNKSFISGGCCNSEGKNTLTRVVIRTPILNNSAVKIDDKQSDVGKVDSSVKEGITAIKLSSGLDFSPKSVLQGDLRHLGLEKCENDPNSEHGRCRRTDGKRWRCSNKVLPYQKYCANHINRGVKKPVTAISTSGKAKDTYGSSPSRESNGPERAKLSLGLDTNLNISLNTSPTDPRLNIEDDNVAGSGGSGSTTETTVTDDSTDFSEMVSLSS